MTQYSPDKLVAAAQSLANVGGPYGKRGLIAPAHKNDCAFLANGVTLEQHGV
ncbi:MAG: hypothetical protein ABL882_06725 [Sphingopyxis sp.]